VRPDGERLRRVRLHALNTLEQRLGMPYPIPSPRGRRAIDEIVRAADVVHVHDCLYLTSVAAAGAARRHGRPVLVTQHVAIVRFLGGIVDPFLAAAYRTIGKGILERAAHVAFVNESVRDWFMRSVSRSMTTSVVPNAVDTVRFRPAAPDARIAARAALGVPAHATVVLFAGRLVAKKRFGALVEALPADAHLLVTGDGPERRALAPMGARVTHVPHLAHARMADAYAAADVFALPSYGEGLPISLIEALASGRVCVVSDDPAFAAVDGCAAVVRAPIASLSAALRRVIDMPADERARREAAGRRFAEESYGLAAFAGRYLALIGRCAEGGAPAH
jgi:glycosyltransferase involved in cell wall biosynthesis